MIASALIIIFLTLILCNYLQNMIIVKKSKLPTLRYSFPLLGHTLYFFGSNSVFYEKMIKILPRFKNMALVLGTVPISLLYDHKVLSKFLSTENHILRKAYHYKFLETIGDRNIFSSSGTAYKESKRVLLEAVSHGNLKGYMASFNRNSKIFVENLKNKVGQKEFKLDHELNFCVVSNVLDTVLGLESSIMTREEIIKFSEELSSFFGNIFYRAYCFWLYPDFIFKMTSLYRTIMKSRKFLREKSALFIEARREKLKSSEDLPSVFIDKYFQIKKENGENFSTEDIIDEVLSILIGGIETSVSSMGFVILLLAIHKDFQEKVHAEIDSLNVDELDFKTVNELVYLDRVLHESWRLYSPVSIVGRKLNKDSEWSSIDDGGILEKGTDVFVALIMLHRDPDVFPNPLTFNPDNFTPDKVASRPAMSYMPFGFGHRKCFGNNFAKLILKTMLYHIFKNYEFSTTKTEKDFKLAFDLTLKNEIGIPVSITSRK